MKSIATTAKRANKEKKKTRWKEKKKSQRAAQGKAGEFSV